MCKHFFPSDDLATRDKLLKLCTIASDQFRSNLGVALTRDAHGNPITVATRIISSSSSIWVTVEDVKIRFPSSEVAKVVYN